MKRLFVAVILFIFCAIAPGSSLADTEKAFSGGPGLRTINLRLPATIHSIFMQAIDVPQGRASMSFMIEEISTGLKIVKNECTWSDGVAYCNGGVAYIGAGGHFRLTVRSKGVAWKISLLSSTRFPTTERSAGNFAGFYSGEMKLTSFKSSIPYYTKPSLGRRYFEELIVSYPDGDSISVFGGQNGFTSDSVSVEESSLVASRAIQSEGNDSCSGRQSYTIHPLNSRTARVQWSYDYTCPDGKSWTEQRKGVLTRR